MATKTKKSTTTAKRSYTRKPKETRAYHPSDARAVTVFQTLVPDEITVNENTALTFTAVWSAVRCISGTVASLPMQTYMRLGDVKQSAREHPLYTLLHDLPNNETSAFLFWETIAQHLLLWGNSYAEIVRDNLGRVVGLYQLLPNMMYVHRDTATQQLVYTYSYSGGTVDLSPFDVLHIPGLSFDGLIGYSPIQIAKRAITLGMAAESFGQLYYERGATPPYAIVHPGVLGDAGRDYLQQYVQDRAIKRMPPVLEEDIKITEFKMDADSSQFLASRQHSINDIARFFNIPASKIGGSAPNNTYANIEAQNTAFIQDSIAPWLKRIEQEVNRKLFIGTDYYAEFNLDAYLRGDTTTRYQAYAVASGNAPWLTVNDIRAKENLPPIVIQSPEPDPVSTQNDNTEVATNAMKPVLIDTLQRMATKERNAVSRLVAKADKQGITAFYGEHKTTLRHALAPALLGLSQAMGTTANDGTYIAAIADDICARALLDAQELPQVERKMLDREGHIEQTAQEILDRAVKALKEGANNER